MLASMQEEIRAKIDTEQGLLARIRAWPTVWRRAGLLLLLSLVAARGLLAGERWPLVATFALIAAASLMVSLRPVHKPEAPTWMRIALPGFAVIAALGSALILPSGDAPISTALGCFVPGMGVSLVFAGAYWLVRRVPLRFSSIAAACGAGLIANALLAGRCPMAPSLEHQLLGHASLVVLLLGATWTLGLISSEP